MVNIVEDWKSLERYARKASADRLTGLYQIIEAEGKAEIRVWIGNCGFIKQYETPAEKELMDILDFCWKEQFTEIIGNIADENFFDPTGTPAKKPDPKAPEG